MDSMEKHILKGQHSHILNLSAGIHTILVNVDEGKIRINHCCYTPDGGTWLDVPNGNRNARYDITGGETKEITFDIRYSFGKLDRIEIVNCKFIKQAIFSYKEIGAAL